MKFIKHILLIVLAIINNSPLSPTPRDTSKLTNEQYLEYKLKEFHLAIPPKQFHYSFTTEVHASNIEQSFELDSNIEEIAKTKHFQLNNSPFFDVSFITQPDAVRHYQLKAKAYKGNVGQVLTFTTSDGLQLKGTYFDRGSDCLVVVGPGFTNEREKMAPFAHIFAEYDVVFFDYRGHGYTEMKLTDPATWPTDPLQYAFGVDTTKARLGLDEEKDVCAVVNGAKKLKNYKIVAGMGLCYSGLIFVKAQALHPDLFTHLILDGAWLSLGNFADTLSRDLKRLCTPQRGGWENFWLTTKQWGRDLISNTAEAVFNMRFKAVSILDFLPYLPKETKVLFFHGKDDLVISRQEFETIWNATHVKEKTAILTSNPHVWNHLKQKELYKLVCDLFLTTPHEQMVGCLHDKQKLIEYEAGVLKQLSIR